MFIECVISQTLSSGSGTVQKQVRKCVLFPCNSRFVCIQSAWPVFQLNLKRNKRSSPQRQARIHNATFPRRVNGHKKKSQNKLRLTSLRLGTIAFCVWKLIGSATASFHHAEWKGLFVATGITKGKQSHLLSAVWVCPSEAAWLCTSIYWGSRQLLHNSSLPTVGLSSSQQIINCLMKWNNEDYLK